MTQPVVQCDVAVVGTGGAGLAAAIEARGHGADVVMLDCAAAFGGASVISGGGCFMVDTPLQAQWGIKDSVEMAYEDWLAWGGEDVDREWARYYIERSRPDLYDWIEGFGVHWNFLKAQEGNRVMRWHQSPGGGQELTTALYEAAQKAGAARWFWRTGAERLEVDRDRITGVRARNLDTGDAVEIRSRAIVMATGGFMSNAEMVYRSNPRLQGIPILLAAAPNSTGVGHRLIAEAGGHLVHMDAMWIYAYGTPDFRDPAGQRGILVRGIRKAIWVNMQGARFHNESRHWPATATPDLLAQSPPQAWALFDGTMLDDIELADPAFRDAVTPVPALVAAYLRESPHVHFAPSLDALASAIHVPTGALTATVERYNAAVREGRTHDPDVGRPLTGTAPLAVPPFVAIKFMPTTRKSLGGVKTTLQCEVVRPDGSVIPGLYAAGELAGMAGGHINGRRGLEGTMLGPALLSGRVAGRSAALSALRAAA